MKIPDEKIEEIREATDIVEIITQHVTLKKRGKSFVGLCPFHSEKTPSFSVDPVRGFYHCFGCGAGGNIFTFVMQMENVGFPEAVRSLADKAGIPIPNYHDDNDAERETEALYHANHFAGTFFQKCLTDTEEGNKALNYILKRQFNRKTIEDFQIGYAPDTWDKLLNEGNKGSIRPEILKQAGLVVPRNDGKGYYDRFRGRLMFPIMNPSGRIVGFGGRTLKKNEKGPKYLNSPETKIYQKSRLLYGLFQAKTGIRREDQAILVEGYTDLMRLFQCGLDYTVATSGTSLTEQQAKILFRYTKNIILVFDGDSAGFTAALRGLDVLLKAGLHVHVAPLREGSDPDTFLRDHGVEAMAVLLNSAQTLVDFHLGLQKKKGRLETPEDRAAVTRVILDTISYVQDPLERNLMIKDLSEKIGVEESLLVQQLHPVRDGVAVREGSPDKVQEQSISSARETAEINLLKLLIEDRTKWGGKIFQHIQPNHFQKKEARILIDQLYEGYLQGDKFHTKALSVQFSERPLISKYLSKIMADPLGESVDRNQLGLDCLLSLKQEEIQKKIRQIQEKMKSSKGNNRDDLEYRKKYLKFKDELAKTRKTLITTWKKNLEI